MANEVIIPRQVMPTKTLVPLNFLIESGSAQNLMKVRVGTKVPIPSHEHV